MPKQTYIEVELMSDFYSIVQLQIQLDELVHKVNCLHGKLKIVNVKAHEKEWRALGRELISKSKGRLRFHQIAKDEFVLDIFDEEDHDAQEGECVCDQCVDRRCGWLEEDPHRYRFRTYS